MTITRIEPVFICGPLTHTCTRLQNRQASLPEVRAMSPGGASGRAPAVLRLDDGLPERDPEPVDVADDELAHPVEGVVQVLDDLHPIAEARAEAGHVVRMDVEVDLPPKGAARVPACV